MSKILVRGVSLLEALVAMGVMAFGILGVMGMQLTLRSNADMAKQRSQATRIAQEQLETWRSYAVLANTAGFIAYDDIISLPATTVTPLPDRSTTYQVTGQVTDRASYKTLVVDVTWTDRNNEAQKVSLTSLMSKVHPALAASLVVKSSGTPTANPMGRHRSIPMGARDFGDGFSGFRPPQAVGGTVAWLFNNETGLIDLCSTSVPSNADVQVRGDLTDCLSTGVDVPAYMLLSGYIGYATGTDPPSGYGVLFAVGPYFPVPELQVVKTAPSSSTTACFRSIASLTGIALTTYYCAVPVTRGNPVWSGSVQFMPFALTPTAFLASTTAENRSDYFKVCRFREIGDYTNQRVGMRNENFVLIRAGDNTSAYMCPVDVSWPHQPTP
jgi:Tfp pilus assembly protein PilV